VRGGTSIFFCARKSVLEGMRDGGEAVEVLPKAGSLPGHSVPEPQLARSSQKTTVMPTCNNSGASLIVRRRNLSDSSLPSPLHHSNLSSSNNAEIRAKPLQPSLLSSRLNAHLPTVLSKLQSPLHYFSDGILRRNSATRTILLLLVVLLVGSLLMIASSCCHLTTTTPQIDSSLASRPEDLSTADRLRLLATLPHFDERMRVPLLRGEERRTAFAKKWRRRTMQLLFANRSGLVLADLLGMVPRDPAAVCELFLIGHPQCRIRLGEETMLGCVARHGWREWTRVLQPQCTRSAFWQKTVRSLTSSEPPKEAGGQQRSRLRMDPVVESHWGREEEEKERREIPPAQRTYATPHEALNCTYGKVFPLGFCVPSYMLDEEEPEDDVPLFPKIFEWFPSIPSVFPPAADWEMPFFSAKQKKKYPATRHDEYVMRMVHRLSLFAWTHTRGGPDCMRHHEILSAGGVPYFPDLPLLPPERVSMLPRQVLEGIVGGGGGALSLPILLGVEHIGSAPPAPVVPFGLWALNSSSLPRSNSDGGFFVRDTDRSALALPSTAVRVLLRLASDAASALVGADSEPHGGDLFFHVNIRRLGTVNWSTFDVDAYMSTASELMRHTRRHLRCGSVAAYVLRTLDVEKPKQIMYVGSRNIDYMSVLLEVGLSELGVAYTVYRPGQHHRLRMKQKNESISVDSTAEPRSGEAYAAWLARDTTDYYGLGFGTSRRLDLPQQATSRRRQATNLDAMGADGQRQQQAEEGPCAALRQGRFDVWIWSHMWPRSTVSAAMRAAVSFQWTKRASDEESSLSSTTFDDNDGDWEDDDFRVKDFLCFDEVVRQVRHGSLKAAFVDGGDAPASAGYPGLTRRGITVFSREPSC
jgi:hypothetical protein